MAMTARISRFKLFSTATAVIGVAIPALGGCAPVPVQTGAEDNKAIEAAAPPRDADLKAAKTAADQFLVSLERRDFADAVASMTPGAKQFTSSNALAAIVGGVEKKHGKIVGHTGPKKAIEASGDGGPTTMTLTYDLTVARGTSTVSLVLLDDSGSWHTQSFQFSL